MKPKHLAVALVVVGVLIAGVMLLLIPEDDGATPRGSEAEQEVGAEGLPTFRAELGEPRPAEPLTPAVGAAEPVRETATSLDESGWRSVSGTVVRASDASPLAGANVFASLEEVSDDIARARFSEVTAKTTDDNGHFELRAPPDFKTLYVSFERAWPDRGQFFSIEPGGEALSGLEIVFDSGFTITGLVLDESGRRLAGGVVSVASTVEERCNESGEFVIRDVAPREGVAAVRVSARAPGHARATQAVRVPEHSSQRVSVELRLPLGGAIAGRVTDSRGAPLEGVQAAVAYVMTTEHGEQAQGGLAGTSDAHGEYLIDSVPAGRYVVEVGYGAGLALSGGTVPDGFEIELDLPSLTPSGVSADSNLSMGARIAQQLAAAKGVSMRWFPEVVVQTGQTTRLDVQLFSPCSVAGRVLDETGSPVVDAHVTLERIQRWPAPDISGSTITSSTGLVITTIGKEDGTGQTVLAEVEGEARTDARGDFELAGLMDGQKQLGITSAGLVSQTRAFDLQPAEARTGEDFVLERGMSVRGRVRDVMGSPIEGANVEISASGAETVTGEGLTTDANGRFEISGLPPGPKRLLVFKAGFSSVQTHVEPGGVELELTMKPAPTVIGVVTNGVSGDPITDFDITVAYEGSSWTHSGSNHPEGRFEMPIDEDTLCTVSVRSGGFREVVMDGVLPSRTALDPLQFRLLPE